MTVSLKSRILTAILYADIFHYPLTVRELEEWMPSNNRISKNAIRNAISYLIRNKRVEYTPPFLYMRGHKMGINNRIERLSASTNKWRNVRRIAHILRFIPTIELVGVTGGLAVNNAENKDDIDLFVVTKPHVLWVTRFVTTLLVELVTKRRHPTDIHVKNAICLNMFIADSALQIPKKEQGWYAAHEVLQMVPLWERNSMYTKYLRANIWTRRWFANKYDVRKQVKTLSYKSSNYCIKWCQVFEKPIMQLQLWYMRNRRTTEVVSGSIIRFHPNDARIWIRKSFTSKLHIYKVPLDKRFNQI